LIAANQASSFLNDPAHFGVLDQSFATGDYKMTTDQYIYAAIIGIISTTGAFFGSWFSSRAAVKSSVNALQGIDRQLQLQHAAKIAEFRQAWINSLRDAMASYQSYGVTPNLGQSETREFYKFGTEIELYMNRDDPRYLELHESMYSFLSAKTTDEKYACNAPYVRVCQDILKNEWDILKRELAKAASPASQSN
jgi:hypothetical protein